MATASLNRSLVGRAVHIKIYPRPRTITESREVLHILERYGEVTMYRNLKYEPQSPAPNTALAIFQSPESASRAMAASPIHFVFNQGDEVKMPGSLINDGTGNALPDEAHSSVNQTTRPNSQPLTPGAIPGLPPDPAPRQPSTPAPTQRTSLWGSRFFNVMPALPTPSTTPFPTSQCTPAAETLTPPSTIQTPAPTETTITPPPFRRAPPINPADRYRPATLRLQPSSESHAAYIARQAYYGPFRPKSRTIPGVGLQAQLPPGMRGMADTRVGAPEAHLRSRIKLARLSRENDLGSQEERKKQKNDRRRAGGDGDWRAAINPRSLAGGQAMSVGRLRVLVQQREGREDGEKKIEGAGAGAGAGAGE